MDTGTLFLGSRQIVLSSVNLYTTSRLEHYVDNGKLKFGDRVILFEKGRGGAKLVRFEGKKCGWIQGDAILASNDPLKVGKLANDGIEGFEELLGSKDSALNAKVLVPKVLVRNLPGKKLASGVPFYYAPGGEDAGVLQIFGVYNIYGYKTYGKDVYFLLGTQKIIKDTASSVLLGWVKAEHTTPWGNSINLYYTPGKTDVPIYENSNDAQEQRNPIAIQKYENIRENNIPRFPMLDKMRINKNTTIYKIAFAEDLKNNHYQEVFVRQDENDPDFTFWLSMIPTALYNLEYISNQYCEELRHHDSVQSLHDTAVQIMKVVTGDIPDVDKRISDFLSEKLYMPRNYFSGVLRRRLGELSEFAKWYVEEASDSERTNFRKEVCLKSTMLSQVKNGIRVDMKNMEFNPQSFSWTPKEGTAEKFNWLWNPENSIRYYYIPLEYIP